MDKNVFEEYERVVEVFKRKKQDRFFIFADFWLDGILSFADVLKNSRKCYFLAEKDNHVYLLTIADKTIIKSEIFELKSLYKFSKVEYNGFMYKKYRVLK